MALINKAYPVHIGRSGQKLPFDSVSAATLGHHMYAGATADIPLLSIASAESFGTFEIENSTVIYSAVGAPVLPDEGDIRVILDPYIGHLEMILSDRDVEQDPGLESAVWVTLGIDREAEPDDTLPDNSFNRGGWVGDLLPVLPTDTKDKMGTRLWLLQRSKSNQDTVNKTKDYLKEGFQWMLDDNVISKLFIDAWIVANERKTVAFVLGLLRPNTDTVYFKFYYNWENQKLRRV